MMNAFDTTEFDAGQCLTARLLGFVRFLHEQGYPLGVAEGQDALRLADGPVLLQRHRLRWSLRALLCGNGDDWQRFDELFEAYWHEPNRRVDVPSSASQKQDRQGQGAAAGSSGQQPSAAEKAGQGDDSAAGGGASQGGASRQAIATSTDFRFLTNPDEQRAMEALVARMARRMRRVLARRQRLSKLGRRLHLRATVRHSLRYGGIPLKLVHREPKRLPPRLVLLLDVSRSMNLYSTLFLRFARALMGAFKDVEVFVYHTHLVQVTSALREADSVRMKEKLALIAQGWSGGTRIGECFQAFATGAGRRLLNRRTLLMVVSDGYDTGDPQVLSDVMRALHQRARKVIWLNPLLARAGYQPVAAGMQAALPHIDRFLPAHNLDSLLALESELL